MSYAVNFVNGLPKLVSVSSPSNGDIDETSFAGSNNQSEFTNITGLVFNNANVRAFKVLLSIDVQATIDKFENIELNGIQNNSDWAMSITSTGDISGIEFNITSAGQVQYTSPSFDGFSSLTFKFRSWVTGV